MRVVSCAKYLKSMHRLSQIFAGMSCTTSNLNIECLICRSPGNDNTRFVGIVENNAICDMPGSTVKIRCTTHTSFFLYSEDYHQGWMWQLLFNGASHNFQDDRNSCSIICAEICSSIAV